MPLVNATFIVGNKNIRGDYSIFVFDGADAITPFSTFYSDPSNGKLYDNTLLSQTVDPKTITFQFSSTTISTEPATTSEPSSTTPIPTPTSTSSSPTTSTPASNTKTRLATKVGVGVGISLGVTCIVLITALVVVLRRQRVKNQESHSTEPEYGIDSSAAYRTEAETIAVDEKKRGSAGWGYGGRD